MRLSPDIEAIRAGDALVTAREPGRAAKAIGAGRRLGLALETLDRKAGMVLTDCLPASPTRIGGARTTR